jgi:hypothetical protein
MLFRGEVSLTSGVCSLDRPVKVAGILRAFRLAVIGSEALWPHDGPHDRQLVFVNPHLSVSPIWRRRDDVEPYVAPARSM